MFLLCLFVSFYAAADSLPRQYITDTPWTDEFSDRIALAPFQQVYPQPLQITAPQFENLFSTLTSVQSRSNGSPTTSIRGSSQSGRVLFLLDNIPLNFLDGFGGSSLFVPHEILDHINVFTGPTSAVYGANALGGSIHFVPQRRATPLLRLGLSETDNSPLSGGTLSSANLSSLYPLVQKDNHQLQASLFLEKDRGDFPYTDATGRKAQRNDNAQRTQRYTLLGKSRFESWQLSYLLLFVEQDKTTPGPTISPLTTQQNSKGFLSGFSLQRKIGSSALWTSRLSTASLHSDFFDFTKTKSNSDKLWLHQNVAWEFAPGYLSQTLVDINLNYYTASFVQDQKYDRTEPEFAQSFILPITKKFLIEPTVRYLTKYNEWVYQLSAPYQFEYTKLWFLYSQGFRPASLTDLYANTSYYLGNPLLLPERSKQYEVGSSFQHENLQFSSSLFRIEYENLFQSQILPSTQFTKVNVGEANTYGINAKMEIHEQNWAGQVSHSYMLARDNVSQRALRFSPEHQTFISLQKRFKKSTWTLQQTFWSSFWDLDYINNRDIRLAAWESTDLLATWVSSKKWTTQMGIYNLWNKRRELTYGYPEPQRRVALAVEYAF